MVDGFQSTQVQCDNCGQVSHPRERCFDLYPKLRSGRGGAAQRGRGGRGGGGGRGTPMVRAPPLIIPPPTTKAAMATRIEQLEQRLATMASFQHQSHSKGEAPTSYGGDDLFYVASVAQIEASVAMTEASLKPRNHVGQLWSWIHTGVKLVNRPGFLNHSCCLKWLGLLPWFLHRLLSQQWSQRHRHHV